MVNLRWSLLAVFLIYSFSVSYASPIYELSTEPTTFYSTAKYPADIRVTNEFSNLDCAADEYYGFFLTIPVWYGELEMSGDVNAFVMDGNTASEVSCTYEDRILGCQEFADANKMYELDNFTVIVDATTDTGDGNPMRNETWNAKITCTRGTAKTETELTQSFPVLEPVIYFVQPADEEISGTAEIEVSEFIGIPYYIKLVIEHPTSTVPELSDSFRGDGWIIDFDTTQFEDANITIFAYACDNKTNCGSPIETTVRINNLVAPPPPPGDEDSDLLSPVISENVPFGMIAEKKPVIAATVTDNNGVEAIWMSVDDVMVYPDIDWGSGRVSYQPIEDLVEGKHTVFVLAFDYNKNRAEKLWEFTVVGTGQPAVNQAPEIQEIKIYGDRIEGNEVGFYAEVDDENYYALDFFWNFGDGQTSAERSPAHIYTLGALEQQHTYIVSLRVSDSEFVSEYSMPVTVGKEYVPQPGNGPDSNTEELPIFSGIDKRQFGIFIVVSELLIFALIAISYIRIKPKLPGKLLSWFAQQMRKLKPKLKKTTSAQSAEKDRDFRVAGRKQFDMLWNKKPIAEKLSEGFSNQEKEEVKRLVFLLENKSKTYSREEIVQVLLGEGYNEKITEKVVELLFKPKR